MLPGNNNLNFGARLPVYIFLFGLFLLAATVFAAFGQRLVLFSLDFILYIFITIFGQWSFFHFTGFPCHWLFCDFLGHYHAYLAGFFHSIRTLYPSKITVSNKLLGLLGVRDVCTCNRQLTIKEKFHKKCKTSTRTSQSKM